MLFFDFGHMLIYNCNKIEFYKNFYTFIGGNKMALPRVFISSTYYDLKYIRDDIGNFISQLGYEPVMHDRGKVAYSQSESLERSCYDEVSKCDIIICVIGGKFGTQSEESNYSITMQELNNAIRAKKKVYIYIVNDVFVENKTYLSNQDKNFIPCYTDDIRVHQYISEIKDTVRNSPIIPFNSVSDIIDNLKNQFAGLFQYLLTQESAVTESATYYDLQQTSFEIKEAIKSFIDEKENMFDFLSSMHVSYNLLLERIRKVLDIQKFFLIADSFAAVKEMLECFDFIEQESEEGYYVFKKTSYFDIKIIYISHQIFDENMRLKRIRNYQLIEEYIKIENLDTIDEELPFN